MSLPEQALESSGPALQAPPRPMNAANGARDLVAEGYPPRLESSHLMRAFDLKPAQFYKLRSAGKFDRFRHKPVIGHVTYSRELLQQWLDGQAVKAS